MTKTEKECLIAIADAVQTHESMERVTVQLPVNTRDEREKICSYLEKNGYIDILDVYGKNYIVCSVQEKALALAIKVLEEEHT